MEADGNRICREYHQFAWHTASERHQAAADEANIVYMGDNLRPPCWVKGPTPNLQPTTMFSERTLTKCTTFRHVLWWGTYQIYSQLPCLVRGSFPNRWQILAWVGEGRGGLIKYITPMISEGVLHKSRTAMMSEGVLTKFKTDFRMIGVRGGLSNMCLLWWVTEGALTKSMTVMMSDWWGPHQIYECYDEWLRVPSPNLWLLWWVTDGGLTKSMTTIMSEGALTKSMIVMMSDWWGPHKIYDCYDEWLMGPSPNLWLLSWVRGSLPNLWLLWWVTDGALTKSMTAMMSDWWGPHQIYEGIHIKSRSMSCMHKIYRI